MRRGSFLCLVLWSLSSACVFDASGPVTSDLLGSGPDLPHVFDLGPMQDVGLIPGLDVAPPDSEEVPSDLFGCPQMEAGVVPPLFSTSFESGKLQPPFDYTYADSGDSLTVSTVQPHTGQRSAECAVGPPAKGQAAFWKKLAQPHQTLFARLWIYLPPGFSIPKPSDGGHGHLTVLELTRIDGWTNLMSVSIHDDNTLYLWNAASEEAYGFGQGQKLSTGTWRILELKVTVSDSNGEARLWLDGQPEITATGIDTGSDPILAVSAGIYWAHPQDQANRVFVDDLAIDEHYLGPCR